MSLSSAGVVKNSQGFRVFHGVAGEQKAHHHRTSGRKQVENPGDDQTTDTILKDFKKKKKTK